MPARLKAPRLTSLAISRLISRSGRGLQAEQASPRRRGDSRPSLHSADGLLAAAHHSAKWREFSRKRVNGSRGRTQNSLMPARRSLFRRVGNFVRKSLKWRRFSPALKAPFPVNGETFAVNRRYQGIRPRRPVRIGLHPQPRFLFYGIHLTGSAWSNGLPGQARHDGHESMSRQLGIGCRSADADQKSGLFATGIP